MESVRACPAPVKLERLRQASPEQFRMLFRGPESGIFREWALPRIKWLF